METEILKVGHDARFTCLCNNNNNLINQSIFFHHIILTMATSFLSSIAELCDNHQSIRDRIGHGSSGVGSQDVHELSWSRD